MKFQKAFVRQDNSVVIKCPACLKAKIISAAKFKDRSKSIKVRCSCQAIFTVFFEFRRTYRKATNLAGSYVNLSLSKERHNMTVQNISLTGLGFNTEGKHKIEKGHELEVRFLLEESSDAIINERVIVRLVEEKFIGCEFLAQGTFNKSLGFYLLP
jgi:hypothetical protein